MLKTYYRKLGIQCIPAAAYCYKLKMAPALVQVSGECRRVELSPALPDDPTCILSDMVLRILVLVPKVASVPSVIPSAISSRSFSTSALHVAQVYQGNADFKKREIGQLKAVVEKLQAEENIRKLQYTYGYYLDKCLYKEVADLYADHPDTCVEFLGGRFNGKEGVKRLYIGRFANTFVAGRNGPIHGFLLDHPQMQGIVDVNPEGTRAAGRFRSLMSAGTHESIKDTHPRGLVQWWEGGIYENEYIKEKGVWKIFRLKYFPFWHAAFDKGWAYTKPNYVPFLSKTFPEDPNGPDHPVTGDQVAEDDLRAPHFGEGPSTSGPPLVLSRPQSDMDAVP
ncbi:hypothetical protein GMOD_00009884 [Pyrenophora seminiperda CCB06]|uniref:SnoaL-like domain-containing protein n=1 Tax=Pyrenophora seminiperda CCB06 TaxID=1302712 RepID=A0A3M7MEP4_9PLEO|nr:hypothetical protein GMOD_00009884 [Pyrenophora seminiperda CCB06]